MAQPRTLIVIGTSVGGVEALRALAAAMPGDLAAAILVVLHIGAHRSELPALLDQAGPLPARRAEHGMAIEAGCIYVAPPDHHMLVEPGQLRLSKGPSENWARPAIDPLFRSAARAYGSAVVGVILTGGLSDGTAGLYEVKRRGGMTIVQDPADAVSPGMPRSALAHVQVDHCVTLARLPALLVGVVAARAGPPGDGEETVPAPRHPKPAEAPVHGAAKPDRYDGMRQDEGQQGRGAMADYRHDQPFALTCPDCGGGLRRRVLGTVTQFACHIGHVYTAEVMVAAQAAALERFLEAALRSLGERGELCRQMAGQSRDVGDETTGQQWDLATVEADGRGAEIRRMLEAKWIDPEIG